MGKGFSICCSSGEIPQNLVSLLESTISLGTKDTKIWGEQSSIAR